MYMQDAWLTQCHSLNGLLNETQAEPHFLFVSHNIVKKIWVGALATSASKLLFNIITPYSATI